MKTLGAVLALVIGSAVFVSVLLSGVASSTVANTTITGGTFNAEAVPNGWGTILASVETCPEFPPAVLAAQLEQESAWNSRAVSPVGAQGLAQFMPETWASWGRDGDGDGVKDPFNPADAITAQAAFDCHLVNFLKGHGLPGTTELALAAYNAGPGNVLKYKGIPPFRETQNYVKQIMGNITTFGSVHSIIVGSEARQAVIDAAHTQIGVPYVWGGGNKHGPTGGGFDCSSLMQFAFYQGAGINLPRTTKEQVKATTPIPRSELAPGDVIYFGPPGKLVNHVGMWLGNGKMLHAPRTGRNVEITTVTGNRYWESKQWHPRRIINE